MPITPYLFLDGRCEEALNFYRDALDAKIEALMRFRDAPATDQSATDDCAVPPGSQDKVMHASLRIGDATIMASDGRCEGRPTFAGFALTLNARDDDHAQTLFGALSQGGQVQMPLEQTFFASRFGMVADRFGVPWMVISQPRG